MGFMGAEELGTTPTPACSSRKGCKERSFRYKVLTNKEAEVVARIEREMERARRPASSRPPTPGSPAKRE